MHLSLATLEDLPFVERMARDFANEYPFPAELNLQKIQDTCRDFLSKDKNEFIVVLANDPHPIGMLAGRTIELLFSSEKIAVEMMWWVDKDYRTGNTGWELMKAFEYWAGVVGCKYVQMASVQTDIGERLDKVYKRKGYILAERNYLKAI